jgi:hypothetical protein
VVFRPAEHSGNLTTQAESLQTAYNSSQQELVELRAAALEACQAVEEDDVQTGSSMASRLRALGRHVLTVNFGAPSMFITLWFGFDYGTNPPLGTLII